MTIIIEEELSTIIPSLENDELKRLTDSLLLEGCRDPLVLWGKTLVDGHNRYAICTKYNLPFKTVKVKLENITEAKIWIINNQLARRNLTPAKMRYFRGKRYEIEKQEHGGQQSDGQKLPIRTSQMLAEEYGVAERTIRNDAEFARAVDKIAAESAEGEKKKLEILRGDINQKDVIAIAQAKDTEIAWKGILESKDIEWWTPKKYIVAVRKVLGTIDLDPASSILANKVVQAKKIFTEKDDGLKQEWSGRVFLNPPYGGTAGAAFAEKLYESLGSDVDEAILLVNSRATDAEWFQKCFNGLICFTHHRIDFDSPNKKISSSTHGSCFVYFGPNEDKFAKEFGGFGNVVKRWP